MLIVRMGMEEGGGEGRAYGGWGVGEELRSKACRSGEHARAWLTRTQTLVGHEQSVNSLAWLPDNDFVMASASDDFSVRLWGPRRLQDYMQ
eukprot:445574-Hanusia_phi.AAC.2